MQLSRPAFFALERLRWPARRRVVVRLGELAADPHGLRPAKKLAGAPAIRAARAGHCRIFYLICHAREALCVLAIYAPETEPLKIPYPTVESLEDESEWLTE